MHTNSGGAHLAMLFWYLMQSIGFLLGAAVGAGVTYALCC